MRAAGPSVRGFCLNGLNDPLAYEGCNKNSSTDGSLFTLAIGEPEGDARGDVVATLEPGRWRPVGLSSSPSSSPSSSSFSAAATNTATAAPPSMGLRPLAEISNAAKRRSNASTKPRTRQWAARSASWSLLNVSSNAWNPPAVRSDSSVPSLSLSPGRCCGCCRDNALCTLARETTSAAACLEASANLKGQAASSASTRSLKAAKSLCRLLTSC
mmetsp:Transcript_94687/g.245058  ORF Transcript_94687/g.245058 Transcript_94687/m.245058 type:complete len:214 (-) Transcript_94687:1260-1901(-)